MDKPKARIFVDMDGTIADIHAIPNWFDRIQKEPDFYATLKPFTNLIMALMLLGINYQNMVELCSLSAVDVGPHNTAHRASKDTWLDVNAYFIQKRIYTQCGQRKSEPIGPLRENYILLDDYSKNLNEWMEDGGTAIKIRNNINCVGGNWKGEIIYNQDSVEEIVSKLDTILKKFM